MGYVKIGRLHQNLAFAVMVVTLSILFFILTILFLSDNRTCARSFKSILLFCCFLLALIAAFRPETMSDRSSYLDMWNGCGEERIELGFVVVIDVLREISTNEYWYLFVFALISISLKISAIYRMTTLIWGSLLIYISNMYILHDMIQMRCAIASGLLLHAIYYIVNRKIICFVLITITAFFFHYSALLIIPLWFLNVKHPFKVLYICLIIGSYIVGGVLPVGTLIGYIPIPGIQNLWSMYEHTLGNYVNIYNAMQLGRVAICILLIIYIDKIARYNKYAIVMVKIYAISLSTLVLFSSVPVIAFRVSELYQITEILLIPMIVYTIRLNIYIKRLLVIVVGLAFLLMNILYLDRF